jgi:hypothetical protein
MKKFERTVQYYMGMSDRSSRLKRLALLLLGAGLAIGAAQSTDTLSKVRAGLEAYLKRNYDVARESLTEPARQGSLPAAYVMGMLYRGGQGVKADPVRAYSLLAAAESGAPARVELPGLSFDVRDRAKKALEELSATLDRNNIRLGNVLRTGRDEQVTGLACDYSGTEVRGKVTTFAPESNAVAMVNEIASYSGLKPNFSVRSGNVPNAAAMISGSTRLIVYNPTFMDQVSGAVGESRFSLQSILAHEVGHHLQGHTLQAGGSRPPIELEADEYSGFIMAKMGATLAQAQAAMARLASPNDGPTHPGRQRRLQAIATGYQRGRGDTVTKRAPVDPPPADDPWRRQPPRAPVPYPHPNDPMGPYPPSSQPIAAVCATQAGACRMGVPVPVGTACYCQTPYGAGIPGVAR